LTGNVEKGGYNQEERREERGERRGFDFTRRGRRR
jgi:hypothetical protein